MRILNTTANKNKYMQWFLSLGLIKQLFLTYIIAINIIAFFFFGLDKLKSQLHSRRVSEKGLWFVAFVGGTIGSLLGMHFFRHKTKKTSFQIVFVGILLLQITLILFLFK